MTREIVEDQSVIAELRRKLADLPKSELREIAADDLSPPTQTEERLLRFLRNDPRIRFPTGAQDRADFLENMAAEVLEQRQQRRVEMKQRREQQQSQRDGFDLETVALGVGVVLLASVIFGSPKKSGVGLEPLDEDEIPNLEEIG